MAKDKNKIGVVYSTNPDFEFKFDEADESDTLSPEKQLLRVFLDTKHRAGKKVTIVERFVGKEEDLEDLCKKLKTKLGTGGSAKDGLIVIQGDVVTKTKDILIAMKYKVK
jgi:translation initiation factor 1